MKIIANAGNGKFLLEATVNEIKSMHTAIGIKETKVEVGTNIPIYDYTASVNKVKGFVASYDFIQFSNYFDDVVKSGKEAIDSLKSIKFKEGE